MPQFKLIIKVDKGEKALSILCNSRPEIIDMYWAIMRYGITDEQDNQYSKNDIWNICCPELVPQNVSYFSKPDNLKKKQNHKNIKSLPLM